MRRRKGALHFVAIGFLVIIFLIVAICLQKVNDVENHMAEKNSFETLEDFCRVKSDVIRDTSMFFTEQSRSYIFTEDIAYLLAYCDESKENEGMKITLQELYEAGLTEVEIAPLEEAKRRSDWLREKEIWAMRLVAEANGIVLLDMPYRIREITLKEIEQLMTAQQKKETARSYILGQEYSSERKKIEEHLTEFMRQSLKRRDKSVITITEKIRVSLLEIKIFNLLLVLLVTGGVLLFYYKVVLPFLRYSRQMEDISTVDGRVLEPCGFKEMKKFANMFNHIYTDLLCNQKRLEQLSSIDILTGLSNRAAMEKYVSDLIQAGECCIGFLMLDVDNFKLFNDGFGHLVGDLVLVHMGKSLNQIAESRNGIAGRLGGEEFIIVLPSATADEVERTAVEILDAALRIDIKELGVLEGDNRITVSVGSTVWPRGKSGDIKSMIQQADMALYQAKSRGKNQHVKYTEEEELYKRLENELVHRLEVESDMHRALEKEEFIPFFQPKYDLKTGRICGVEALVRWEHREKGYLYPDYFVPVLEKDGFITKIDYAMFERICCCIREWQDMGLPLVPIACNFSRLNFGKKMIVQGLTAITEKYGVSPSLIQVELTENSLLEKEDIVKMEEELKELHAAGFTIAIDDFGTGYSSLGMLHELSADVLKMDKSFIQRDLSLKSNELLLKGILYIAQTMKMEVIVEGVETKEQVQLLKKLGFRYVQGYYFSKPVKKTDFEMMLKEQEEG